MTLYGSGSAETLHGSGPRFKTGNGDEHVLQTIVTNGGWSAGVAGPVIWDSTYYGEAYDARLEEAGWANHSFVPKDPSNWLDATVQVAWPVDDTTRVLAPGPPWMSSQLMQPIKAVRTIAPVSFTTQTTGPPFYNKSWTYDFGQEFAGVVRLQLPPLTATGTNITLMYAETLAHPGMGLVFRHDDALVDCYLTSWQCCLAPSG
jgi:alpha-L-rhamnosidase